MIGEPQNKISERALTVWRIAGAIRAVIVAALSGGAITLTFIFDWPIWVLWVAITVAIFMIIVSIIIFPNIRWRIWRYEVREQEIELQHGMFVIKRTLVPMIRVQHVDTEQGPILRKYDLATVKISTAATVHEIPALDVDEAEELRVSISRLARVADEDV